MTDQPPAELTEELTTAVRELNATLTEFRPRVDEAVTAQLRVARRAFAVLTLGILVAVGSVSCVVWQRLDQANHERIAQCRVQNANRADAKTRWVVVWDALDKAVPGPQPRIDAVRRNQSDAFDPTPCK